MFYLKHHGEKIEIQEGEIFTTCPQCKEEQEVDLAETILIVGENYEGLDSLMVYCEKCSAERLRAEYIHTGRRQTL